MFFFRAEDCIRGDLVTGVQTCALPISWRAFVDSVIVTRVTGEIPSDTDSGYTFARKARQLLGIPEERRSEERRVGKECKTRWAPKPGQKRSHARAGGCENIRSERARRK